MSWETWSFAFNVTMPNLLILLIGMGLRRLGQQDDAFCDSAMKLVFNLALPFLLFFSVATSQPHSHSKRNKVTHLPESDKITVLAILESLLHAGKTSDSERTVLHRKAAW